MRCRLAAVVLVLALAVANGAVAADRAAPGAEVRISVSGLRSARGVVLIGLYDSQQSFDRAIELAGSDNFLNDPNRVAGAALRIDATLAGGVVFSNLQPGRYAVIAFHDENANGRLDKSLFGVPTEAYGFSNQAQGFLGPPSFERASFDVNDREVSAAIVLIDEGDGAKRAQGGAMVPVHRTAP